MTDGYWAGLVRLNAIVLGGVVAVAWPLVVWHGVRAAGAECIWLAALTVIGWLAYQIKVPSR
jgi:uncharacterized membrane protein